MRKRSVLSLSLAFGLCATTLSAELRLSGWSCGPSNGAYTCFNPEGSVLVEDHLIENGRFEEVLEGFYNRFAGSSAITVSATIPLTQTRDIEMYEISMRINDHRRTLLIIQKPGGSRALLIAGRVGGVDLTTIADALVSVLG